MSDTANLYAVLMRAPYLLTTEQIDSLSFYQICAILLRTT